jgi:flagellar hook assembly protein FlgD
VLKVHAVQAGTATLRLYDVEGRLVRTVLNQEWLSAGDHAVAWDGRDQQGGRAASGVYFAYLRMGPATSAQRIVRIE